MQTVTSAPSCPFSAQSGSTRFNCPPQDSDYRLTKIAARCGHRAENELEYCMTRRYTTVPSQSFLQMEKQVSGEREKSQIQKMKFIAVLAQCLSNELESGWSGASKEMRVSERRGPCPEPMNTLDHHRLHSFCGQIHE